MQASAFPSAQIALDGWMENALVNEPATAVEDRYREILRANRARDAAAGRTLDGPHLTDLQVIYAPKNMPARDASTGEQKALLIGLVLAHATLVAEMTGIVPLLLLDEVVAHLDPDRRKALFDELAKLGAQVWMTGADPAAFADIGAAGEIFDVGIRPGQPAQLSVSAIAACSQRAGPPSTRSMIGVDQEDRAFFGKVHLIAHGDVAARCRRCASGSPRALQKASDAEMNSAPSGTSLARITAS